MKSPVSLEQRVHNLYLAVQLCTAVILIAVLIHHWAVLASAPGYHAVYSDIMRGAPMPGLTRVFLTYAMPIAIGSTVLGLLSIAGLFVFRTHWLPVLLAALVILILFTLTQLATFSFQLPLMHIINSLSA